MANEKITNGIVYLATILFVLGIILLSLGIPLTFITYLIPTGKTELFYTNWVVILGIIVMITSLYIILWGVSFKRLFNFFKGLIEDKKEEEKEKEK